MGSVQSKRDQYQRLAANQRRWLEEQDPSVLAALIAAHNAKNHKGVNGLASGVQRTRTDRSANWHLKQPHMHYNNNSRQHLYHYKKQPNDLQNPMYVDPRRLEGSISPSSTIARSNHRHHNTYYATSCQNLYTNNDNLDIVDYSSDFETDIANPNIDDENNAENNHIFSASTNLPPFHKRFMPVYPYEAPEQTSNTNMYLPPTSSQWYNGINSNSSNNNNINNINNNNNNNNNKLTGLHLSSVATRNTRRDSQTPISVASQPLGAIQLSAAATSDTLRPLILESSGNHLKRHQDHIGYFNATKYNQQTGGPKVRRRRHQNQNLSQQQQQEQKQRLLSNVPGRSFSKLTADSSSGSPLWEPIEPTPDDTTYLKYPQHSAQMHHIIQPAYQRGLDYSAQERARYGLEGLLPVAQQNQELQVQWVLDYLENNCANDNLNKYIFLRHLKDFNETLFYATLIHNVEQLMPIVYTPIVGLACQKFSSIFMRPRGVFISIGDLGNVGRLLANWAEKDVRVIVVTDGERILGLGDLGANGMGISIGKLSLYTALAGVPPKNVLPITLDVGTNNESNLADPFYIGLRQRRVQGEKYDALIEEFMSETVKRWGQSCLIQFEDFGNHNAFPLLQSYRSRYCTFNDDIQGTASVCLSGLISACKIINKRLADCSFLFYGAGEANLGTANLLLMAMAEQQGTEAANELRKRIWLVDSKGLVVSSREDISDLKRIYAQDAPRLAKLIDIVGHCKPSAIIGASAQSGAFNELVCRRMAELNQRPIIFALSNPTSKAECTAEQAYEWTRGKCIFASGSPFDPFTYEGRRYVTGQGNNAYIFPAVGLATIAAHLHSIPEETFLIAAQALSDQLSSADTSVGLVYPRLSRIRDCTLQVAARLLEYFYSERLATYRPEPSDKVNFLKSIQYDPSYSKITNLS